MSRIHLRPSIVLAIFVALGMATPGFVSLTVTWGSGPTVVSFQTALPQTLSGPASSAHIETMNIQGLPGNTPATCSNRNCPLATVEGATPAASGPYWTNLTSATSPAWTYNAAMTFDNASRSVLLFGVNASGGSLGDGTWQFSGGQWTDLSSAVGTPPPYQAGERMAYDAPDGYVLMFGCSTVTSGNCNDTWDFSGGTWHQVDALNPPPASDVMGTSGQAGPLSLAYDAKDSYVVLTNGFDTWSYRSGVWSPFCRVPSNCSAGFIPGPNLTGTAVYDAHDGYVLFVGVDYRNGSIVGGGSWTWKFSGGQWTNLSAVSGTPPSPRVSPMLAYDSTTGSVLLFGGARCAALACGGLTCLNDTWTFQGGVWRNVSSGTAPPPRFDGQMADDPTDSAVILFSGLGAIVPQPNDTWAWGVSPPISPPSITVSPAVPIPGTPAQFNSSFQGGVGPFTHSWRFGDGGTSSMPNPSHTFHADGLYVVSLWVNDSAGHTATASIQVHVYAPLNVVITNAAPDPAALGQPVNFTANATGGTPPYTYAWSFGDGGVGGNLSVITHVYTTNGPFTAQVTVHDAAGGSVGASFNVSILLQALVGSTTTNGSPPLTVHFVGQAQGGSPPYRFGWTFGDGVSSQLQDPTHTYNASGAFTVALTVLDSRNDRSVSSLVVRVGVPSASAPSGPSWLVEFVVTGVIAATVGTAWATSYFVQRARRQEGERWIKELTSDSESRGKKPEP